MQIIENFLSKEELQSIKNVIDNVDFPWFFTDKVSSLYDDSNCYFTHTFYAQYVPNSSHITVINPILEKLDVKALIRSRAILHIGKETLIEHGRHQDFDYSHKALLLYLNTNNGFTRLHDGQCVQSVENRALIFDGSTEHNSTNCTDQKTRKLITINYF